MFNLKEFIKSGFIKAVGKMADYQIILSAVGWLEKGVLTEGDLAEIQTAIDLQYEVLEEPEVLKDFEVTEDLEVIEDNEESEPEF